MLVVANGAFKSGSTWMRDIVSMMFEFEEIPERYQHRQYPHWVNPERIGDLLDSLDYQERNYITKSHLYEGRFVRALVNRPNVYVLDITRDIRDVVVSHYYHLQREKRIPKSFPLYYWTIGRLKAAQIVEYHSAWNQPAHENVYVSAFEKLKTDFEAEVTRLAAFFGLALQPEQLERIREETSIERLRAKRGEDHLSEEKRFFRKGAIGDWKQHLTPRMQKDLERIEADDLDPATRAAYGVLFTARHFARNLVRRGRNRLRVV